MKSTPRLTSRTNKYQQNLTTLSRSFDSMNLEKFPDFMTLNQYSNLSFCHNPITSFLTLPELFHLTSLKLDSTRISSFNGAKTLPQLSSISMLFTPICSSKYFFEMCLIAFGTQLLRINDKIVTSKQRKFAKDNMEILNKYITSGWLITKGSQPIHLLHYQTRKRICFYTVNKQANQNQALEEVPSYGNDYTPVSRSNLITEQNSGSIAYESSYANDSGDNHSNMSYVNNSQFQLDEKVRDNLLSKMIQLSREWNPPHKTQFYDKDNFLDNDILGLFQPSMARNRRLVVRDQRPANLFKLPVSIQTESPYADEKKPYLQRKREEYELKIKQKLEQLKKQEEEEYEYEEEEEEAIEKQEKIKDEDEMQLQDNLKEENNIDNNNNVTIDKDDFNNNNREEEELNELNMPTKEEETLNEMKEVNNDDDQKESELTNKNESVNIENKPEIKQVQIKRKSMPASKTAKIITTPTITDQNKATISSDNNNNSSSNLLSESEMEVFRKRRMMSMNKFILNTNSPKPKTEEPEQSRPIVDDKIVKKRRKTLTHSRTSKNIDTPNNKLSQNSKTSIDLSPRDQMKDRFTRRPTYSEIISNTYKNQHDFSFPSYQKDQLESSFKEPRSAKPAKNLSLLKRKTSFAALDVGSFSDPKSKARTDTDSNKYSETETTSLKETESEPENKNETKKETENENNDFNETEKVNENINKTEKKVEIRIETDNKNENETENQVKIENPIKNENETENKIEISSQTKNDDKNENETENKVEIENSTKNDDKNEDEAKIDSDLLNEINLNQEEEIEKKKNNENDDLIDNEINQFLQKQNTLDDHKSEEEDGKIQTGSQNEIEELKDIEDLQNLDDILKGINDDDDDDENGDLDDTEAELRLDAFQECMKEHPDKADDDDFVNDYIDQYIKTHLKK